MQDSIMLQEADLLEKASLCMEYIQDALQNRDYESMKIEISELQFLVEQLQEVEMKKHRRAQIFEVINDMRKRGIQIDFVSRILG
ncbi:hypothetical protein [Parageobacillus thermoglucosidasius]|nr:hypothetical protein [Parageobacillus thermoglucosidasius]